MSQGNKAIWVLILKVFAWMPVTFFAWAGLIDEMTWLVAEAVGWFSAWALPATVLKVVPSGGEVLVYTKFLVPGTENMVLIAKAPTVLQGFGLPVFVAMALVPPATEWALARRLALGGLVVLCIQCLGVLIGTLRSLRVNHGLTIPDLGELPPAMDQVLSIGDALWVRIVPVLVPVLLWAWLYRSYLGAMVSQGRARPAEVDPASAAPPTRAGPV